LSFAVAILDAAKGAQDRDMPAALAQLDILPNGDIVLEESPYRYPLVSFSGIHYDPFLSKDNLDEISHARTASSDALALRTVGQTCVQFEQSPEEEFPAIISKIGTLPTQFTIEIWLLVNTPPTFNSPLNVIAHYDGAFEIRLTPSGDRVMFGDSQNLVTSNQTIQHDSWHHVALVANATTILLILDGSVDLMVATRDTAYAKCGSGVCGGSNENPLYFAKGFFGRMAEIRIWDLAKSVDALSKLSQTRLGPKQTGLRLNFQFATPQSIGYDHSGNFPLSQVSGPVTWIREGPPLRETRPNGQIHFPTSVLTSNGRIRIPPSPFISFSKSEAFTVEFWFMPSRDSPPNSWVVIKNGAFGVQWQGKSSPLIFFDGTFHSGFKSSFIERNWYHVAMVDGGIEQGRVSLFIDGTLDASDVRGGTSRVGVMSALSIGGIPPRYFAGAIADVRVWRGAHSVNDVRSFMNHPLSGRETGLVGYFKFESDRALEADSSYVATKDRGVTVAGAGEDSDMQGGMMGEVVWQMKGPNLAPKSEIDGDMGEPSRVMFGVVMRNRHTGQVVIASPRPSTNSTNATTSFDDSQPLSPTDSSSATTPSPASIAASHCPNKCSGRGECVNVGRPNSTTSTSDIFECRCQRGFSAIDCSTGCSMWCNDRGTCVDGKCFCNVGYRGSDCSIREDSSQISPHPECALLPPTLPKFCASVTHAVPHAIARDVDHIDQLAFATYLKLSSYCTDSEIGRELMKQSICASFFLGCDANGNPVGVCRSSCEEYSRLCELDESVCRHGMYVGDLSDEEKANATREEIEAATHLVCEEIDTPEEEKCPRNCSEHGT